MYAYTTIASCSVFGRFATVQFQTLWVESSSKTPTPKPPALVTESISSSSRESPACDETQGVGTVP